MSSFIFPNYSEVIGINKQKKDEAIVNEAIRVKEMLVITDTGEKLGVISRSNVVCPR